MRFGVGVLRSVAARVATVAAVGAIVGGVVFVCAAPALAGTPAWRITDEVVPNSIPAGGSGFLVLQIQNTGDAATDGSPVTVVDHLPAGVTATATDGMTYGSNGQLRFEPGNWSCSGVGTSTVTCVNNSTGLPGPSFTGHSFFVPTFYNGWGLINQGCRAASPAFCYPGGYLPNKEALDTMPPPIGIAVSVGASAAGALSDDATVSGGGAPMLASDHSTVQVSPDPTPFGIAGVRLHAISTDGNPDTQAGSHPYSAGGVIKFNLAPGGEGAGLLRGVHAELPAGFLGNVNAYPKCTQQAFEERPNAFPRCSSDTQLGVIYVDIFGVNEYADVPLFSLVPNHGEAAQFGFTVASLVFYLSASIGPGPNHNVVISLRDNESRIAVGFADVTFWGVPSDPSHDRERYEKVAPVVGEGEPPQSSDAPLKPFLTLPTECGQRQTFSVGAEAWEGPRTVGPLASGPVSVFSSDEQGNPVLLDGCEHLDFSPSVQVLPSSTAADSPTGVEVDYRSPQQAHEENPAGLAEGDLKDAIVSLPAGLTVNPGAANGLGVCTEAQVELEGSSPVQCPAASKIGTVEVETPLLEHALPGSLYLAPEYENPFDSLLAGYIVVDDPVSGVRVKLAGELRTDPVTGQITGVFKESPQFPLSSVKLRFFNELATPQSCGVFTATSDLTPWSTPGTADATPSSTFQVTSGAGGGACPGGVLPFAPGFSAGTTSNQAGGYSAFDAVISRSDGEQHLSGVTVRMPPGLLGKLARIPLCGEPQAGLGQCSSASQIGEASAATGVGSQPFVVNGGRVYLTGPYNGGPFGLSIVVPGVAGPFNLGNIVERASIRIDPNTAQVSVVSDALPQMIDSIEGLKSGIPADIRSLNISVNRPGFIFNPTSCEPLAVTGTIVGAQGTTVPVSSRFQAAGCQGLSFKPVFSVSTQAKTSKKQGASLTVKGAFPAGQANIHSVAVTLPKQLPARLTTIQQACPEATFAQNPASCPAGSDIGTATATTPILSNPVSGPAYLVSHGGAAFPDVVAILQGEGVTVDLTGSISIKHNITSSTFATVPDAPITSFEFDLPEGPHSGLAAVVPAKARGSLCGQSLAMPFTITAQNGAVVKQNNKIAVTGCPKTKTVKKKKPKHPKRKARKK